MHSQSCSLSSSFFKPSNGKKSTRVTFIIDAGVITYNKLVTVNTESTIESEMNSMPCIMSLQHKANQDMKFDHLKGTSVTMRHNAFRPVKNVEQWKFFFYIQGTWIHKFWWFELLGCFLGNCYISWSFSNPKIYWMYQNLLECTKTY